MPSFDWFVLILTVALLFIFPTLSSKRSRQHVFLVLCAIGVAAATYGFWIFTQLEHQDFFKAAGLPLSLVIVAVLCFVALTLDRTFDYRQLRTWGYPFVCLWFVIWLGATTALSIWYHFFLNNQVQPIAITFFGLIGIDPSSMKFKILIYWAWIAIFSILAALLSALVWRFNLRLFQVLFPVCSTSFLISIVVHYHYYMATVNHPELLERQATVLQTNSLTALRDVFFIYTWVFFFLIGYFYLNAKFHAERLYQYPFIRKVPTVAVFLVTISFFHAFPEYASFRKAFPKLSEMFESVLMVTDISLILVMTLVAVSGRLMRVTPMIQAHKAHEWS